jgi:hypothetical protein
MDLIWAARSVAPIPTFPFRIDLRHRVRRNVFPFLGVRIVFDFGPHGDCFEGLAKFNYEHELQDEPNSRKWRRMISSAPLTAGYHLGQTL